MVALRRQLYGCGAGLSAFYASMIRTKPSLLFDILRLSPYALRDLKRNDKSLRLGHLPEDFPACLLRATRRGFIEGGLMYAYDVIADRFGHSAARSREGRLRQPASGYAPAAGDSDESAPIQNQNVSRASG
jgi:hypothetical protein